MQGLHQVESVKALPRNPAKYLRSNNEAQLTSENMQNPYVLDKVDKVIEGRKVSNQLCSSHEKLDNNWTHSNLILMSMK